MKKTFFIIACALLAKLASAQIQDTISNAPLVPSQTVKFPELDKSPMDMSYYPADYPMLKTQNKITTPPIARIIYGRPQKDNRVIFGKLVEYNKVWRLGANEATEIEFFKEVSIAGKKVPRGRYTLYAIPTETKWTIILNKDTDSWGAFIYDEKKDLLRTEVPVHTLSLPVDILSIVFTRAENGMNLIIAWDNVSVTVPINQMVSSSKEKAASGKKQL